MTVQNFFRGCVTTVETTGAVFNVDEVPVGADVSGVYSIGDQNINFSIRISVHGKNNTYESVLSTDDDWGVYTPGNFTWNNAINNGLEIAYFGDEQAQNAGGYFSFDMPAAGSTTTTSYMRFFVGSGSSKMEIKLKMDIISIPSPPQNVHIQ